MDFRRDARMNDPPSGYHSGYNTPTTREDIELVRSPPPNDTLSPRPYPEYPKNPAGYQNVQEAAPYYGHPSQQNLVRSELDPPCEPTPWRPGFFRQFPWLGFGALIFSFLCMVGAMVVLVSSNQKPVTAWKVQPTVILAILSAFFSSTLAYALAQGARISWWRQALEGGTVADLSRQWSYGTSARAALLSGRHFNLMALASLMVVIALIDGALLQRASTIITQNTTGETNLRVALAPLLPQDYTGAIGQIGKSGSAAFSPSVITADFSAIMADYQKNIPISTGITGCTGNCSAIVQAAGIDVSCEDPVSTPFVPDRTSRGTLFEVTPGWHMENCSVSPNEVCPLHTFDGGSEYISLNVSYVQPAGDNCERGNIVTTICKIKQAVVEYPVKIDGKSITLDSPPSSRLNVVALSNILAPADMSGGTMTGLYLAMADLFSASVTWDWSIASGWKVAGFSMFPSQFYVSGNLTLQNGQVCLGRIIWRDPIDDILSSLDEIMFRSAVRAAEDKTDSFELETTSGGAKKTFTSASTVTGQFTTTQNVYQTRFAFLIAAAIVMTSGVLAVIPTFYGWWALGRSVTLDPIETAKAFDAPVLGGAPALSNADVDKLVEKIGKRRIVYGEQLQPDGNGERKLTMGILGPRGGP